MPNVLPRRSVERGRSSPPRVRRIRRIALAALLLPAYQGLGCVPDFLGAVNFETQNLINRVIFNIVDTVVRNLLNL